MVMDAYNRWLRRADMPDELLAELRDIEGNETAISDRFFKELEFGTGGLRGIMGAGTNRMNIYTVRKATQGLADYISGLPGARRRVAIAYDSRIDSGLFAEQAGCVLAANGITALIYPRLQPTPALSFAVRSLDCDAGVCVTASHNPAAYNGYKVYGPDGCQITEEVVEAIQEAIDKVDRFDGVRVVDIAAARADGLLKDIPDGVLDDYLSAVFEQRMPVGEDRPPLRVVYTPLNGAGLECVVRILDRLDIGDVIVVPEQEKPDGAFPTCPFPNPEIPQALERGIALCEGEGADLLLATDPDCDRVGVAVRHGGGYALLSGNEVGVLLLDFICRRRAAGGMMPAAPLIITTIVSTGMADAVAQKYGVEVFRTLTGFKFIGEQIGLLEAQGAIERFILGFEESYGYLSGPHVRDKDGVNAAMLVCQMAQDHKAYGHNLVEAMEVLYQEFGWYRDSLHNFTFEGKAGFETMARLLERLRTAPPRDVGGLRVKSVIDYAGGMNGLPKANVLELLFEGGEKAIVRPSGTEPKMKLYLFAHSNSRSKVQETLDKLYDGMRRYLQ